MRVLVVAIAGSAEVQIPRMTVREWIPDSGIRPSGMPGSKAAFSDDELWSIVVFLRICGLPASRAR